MVSFLDVAVSSFPDDAYFWRVDFIYNISGAPNSREPEIQAHISRLPNYQPGLKSPFDYSSDRRSIIYIGMGHISLIYMGSVWQHQKRVANNKLEKITFTFNTEYSRQVPFASCSDANGKYRIFPPSAYWVGNAYKSVQNSPIVCIENNGDPYGILVPLIEILRFYYLLSSPLSLSLIGGTFEETFKSLVEIDDLKQVSIEMPYGWDNNNAWFIARYWSSEITKQRADSIATWAQLAVINKKERVHFNNLFPFLGVTTIKVEGKRIISEDGKERFFCTRLVNCTGPFDFSTVTVITEEYVNPEGNEPLLAGGVNVWPGATPTNNNLGTDEDPTNQHEIERIVQKESRFAALKGKSLQYKKRKIEKKHETTKVIVGSEDTKSLGTGQGHGGESSTKKADALVVNRTYERSQIPVSLDNFLMALAYLRKHMSVVTLGVVPTEDQMKMYKGKCEPPYAFENEFINGCIHLKPHKHSWSLIQTEGKELKYRGLIISECYRNDKYVYVMELERSPTSKKHYSVFVLYKIDFTKIESDGLFAFIWQLSFSEKWPTDSELLVLDRNYSKATQTHGKDVGPLIFAKLEAIGF